MLTTLSPRFAVPEKVGIRLEICGDIADYRWMLIYSGQFQLRTLALWIWLLHVNPSHPWVRLRAASSRRNGPRQVFLDACRKLYLNLTNPTCPRKTTQQIQQHNTYQFMIYIECRIIVESLCVIILISLNSGLCLPWQVTSAPRFGVAEVIREVDANNFGA